MGRNRKKAPIYQYLSKQQYLREKNIPKETPLPSVKQENHVYHHATLITINPFSHEKPQKTSHFPINTMKISGGYRENTQENPRNRENTQENPYEYHQKSPQSLKKYEFSPQPQQKSPISPDKTPNNSLVPLHKSQFQPSTTPKSFENTHISPKALHNSLNQAPTQQFSSSNQHISHTNPHSPYNSSHSPTTNEKTAQNPQKKSPNLSIKTTQFPENPLYPPTDPNPMRSPSHFSTSSPKARLQSLEKTSSDLPSLIETLPQYQRSFNKKVNESSIFEVKAQVLELQDAISQEKERYSALYDTYFQSKANEEVLEARLAAYKESFQALSQTIEEIKELQGKLGERLEKTGNCELSIKNLENEALEIMLQDLKNKENDVETLKNELLRVKSRRKDENLWRDKLLENIRELEREIVELQALKAGDFASSPPRKEQDFPKSASPLRKSNEKGDLLSTLEAFFDSKVEGFEILLKKPVYY